MSKHLKSIIGSRVKAARRAAGLTQASLAEQIGRTTEAVSNIERGRSLPPLDLLEKIAELTGCSLPDLVEPADGEGARPERVVLETRLLLLGRGLTLERLRIAVSQVEALQGPIKQR